MINSRQEGELHHPAVSRGVEARALLDDARFEAAWKSLYEQCPWATSFQSSGFVKTWYGVYESRFEPVVVSERAPDGRLLGFLPLAVSRDSGELVCAGTHHAEYQVWLTEPSTGDLFIENALEALFRSFPGATLTFTFLPAAAPLGWTETGSAYRCTIDRFGQPVMSIGAGDNIAQHFQKPRTRNYLNRLKRLGEVHFEEVRDLQLFDTLFDEYSTYYDLRQGTIAGVFPFHEDPLKKPLYRALMNAPGFFLVAALKVGELTLALHLAVRGINGMAHHYLMGISPFRAKLLDGRTRMFLFGEYLRGRGFKTLDLTPPRDEWKEYFATDHPEVPIVKVFSDRGSFLRVVTRRKLRGALKRALSGAGVDPQTLRTRLGEAKRNAIAKLLPIKRRTGLTPELLRVYIVPAERPTQRETDRPVRRDRPEDLLWYRPDGNGCSLKEFAAKALRRIENGDHAYTLVENGTLVFCGWLRERCDEELARELGYTYLASPRSTALYDFLLHPAAHGHDVLSGALYRMVSDATSVGETDRVFIVVKHDDAAFRSVLESLDVELECRTVRPARPQAGGAKSGERGTGHE